MMPILKVENLSKDFVKSLDLVAKGLNKIGQNYKEEIVHAVDNVNFSIFNPLFIFIGQQPRVPKLTFSWQYPEQICRHMISRQSFR